MVTEKQGERQFDKDKTYLRAPDGQIWEYESMLAEKFGFEPVVPNPSKAEKEVEANSVKK